MESFTELRRPMGVDLFAGAGGLSLGFEQAGFDIAAAIEIDPVHCATHEFNFPHTTTICASVTDLTAKTIRSRSLIGQADIDVVFGGAPCQGFSMMGKRALDDPRNQLVGHFVRLIRELQPKYCVFENVKGLTLGKHIKFLDELIETLEKSGYQVVLPYQVLNAADFGVPQDRRRLFLVAARAGVQLPSYPPQHNKRINVWDAIGDLPDADSFDDLLECDSVTTQWNTTSTYANRMRSLAADATNFGYGRVSNDNCLTSSLRTVHTALSRMRFAATQPGDTEPVSRFHRLNPAGLCNTLRAGTDSARGAFTSPRPIHPILPRVITVREAARLHSYPDWFRFHQTKWHGFRQIGNSVPPLLARAVAGEIMKALKKMPVKPDTLLQQGHPELLMYDMAAAARRFHVPHNVIAQRMRKTVEKSFNLELAYD